MFAKRLQISQIVRRKRRRKDRKKEKVEGVIGKKNYQKLAQTPEEENKNSLKDFRWVA